MSASLGQLRDRGCGLTPGAITQVKKPRYTIRAKLDAGSRGIPDDFEFGCPTDGGKNLVDAAQHDVLDEILGAVPALKHGKTLENDNRVVGRLEGQIARDPGSSWRSPRLQVVLPLVWAWAVDSDHSHIISLHVGRKQDVNRVARQPRQQQIAREVLVVRIRLDSLGVNGIEDGLARDGTPIEAEVHVICPQDSAASNACLDEGCGIIG